MGEVVIFIFDFGISPSAVPRGAKNGAYVIQIYGYRVIWRQYNILKFVLSAVW
jgi:hypothetical protein